MRMARSKPSSTISAVRSLKLTSTCTSGLCDAPCTPNATRCNSATVETCNPQGTAWVTCEDKSFLLSEDQSTYVPLGHKHRLENPGKLPLELIEVQSGAYLGEDDIVRFEDVYGRTAGAETPAPAK